MESQQPASSASAISARHRRGWPTLALVGGTLKTARGITWALGCGVGGWIPAALAGEALDRTRFHTLSGAGTLVIWMWCAAAGLYLGAWLGLGKPGPDQR